MEMCTACSQMKGRLLNVYKHSGLQQTGTHCFRILNRPVRVEHYRCRICGSGWDYTDDARDFRAGWRPV